MSVQEEHSSTPMETPPHHPQFPVYTTQRDHTVPSFTAWTLSSNQHIHNFFFHIFSLFPSLDHCSGRDFLIIHPLFQKVKCRAVCMHVQMCLMVFCACCVQTTRVQPTALGDSLT